MKIDINEVNFDSCAEKFVRTNCSIIYITNDEKMYGIVSKGDVARGIRNSKNIEDVINTNNKFIVYSNDEQSEIEARDIFDKKLKIKDIPVVDEERRILFQYSRTEKIMKGMIYLIFYYQKIMNTMKFYVIFIISVGLA